MVVPRAHSTKAPLPSRMPLAAVAGLLLALALGSCGGGGSGKNTSQNGQAPHEKQAPQASGASGAGVPSAGAPGATASPASGGSGANGTNAAPPGDQDGDGPNTAAFDKDDSFVTSFGHAASPSQRRTVTVLVQRYYAALAKDDGATACSLLFFVIKELIPETYGQTSSDATAGRGKTCGSVLSQKFAVNRSELEAKYRKLHVIAVRVQGRRAWALLRFGPQSVRRLILYLEDHVWKIGALTDTELV